MIRIGTAGWTIPRINADAFPSEGSALERYAARLSAVEINSSFHRPHRASTWARWAESVPAHFRFSAKLPKTVTHQAKLVECERLLDAFVGEVAGLGERLAVLLVQLPPKLAFDVEIAGRFFEALAARASSVIACEPRHASWFAPDVGEWLAARRVARVGADPAVVPEAALPGGWAGLAYWRLHGSPVMYRSSYEDRLASYAQGIRAAAVENVWCIFDNTASSAATGDALALQSMATR